MVIAGFLIAVASFVILLGQEYRHWRDRPRARVNFSIPDATIDIDGQTFHMVNVVNTGSAAARIMTVEWHGVTLRSGAPVDGFNPLVPPALAPTERATLLIAGNPDDGWVRLTYMSTASSRVRAAIEWQTLTSNSIHNTRLKAQYAESVDLNPLQRWRRRNAAKYVGPRQGGTHFLVLSRREGIRTTQISTALGVVESND